MTNAEFNEGVRSLNAGLDTPVDPFAEEAPDPAVEEVLNRLAHMRKDAATGRVRHIGYLNLPDQKDA